MKDENQKVIDEIVNENEIKEKNDDVTVSTESNSNDKLYESRTDGKKNSVNETHQQTKTNPEVNHKDASKENEKVVDGMDDGDNTTTF